MSEDMHDHDVTVHFGEVGGKLPNWQKNAKAVNEKDPDDEELDVTPTEVVAILGFDPKDL